MKRVYNRKDYLIFLDNDYIKKFLNRDIKKYFPGFVECLKVESKYFRVLAATSFLVRYFITLKTKSSFEWTIRMRGNRLNPTSYKIFQYLWNKHGYKNFYYPRPIHYFKKKQFILYENYNGMIYRDYHKKSKYFFNKTIPMIAKRLADLHQTKKSLAKKRTLKQEFAFLDTILEKIKEHNKKFYLPALKTIAIIKKYLQDRHNENDFTLIHNDFQASNIIYNRLGSHLGIIDYENFCQFFPAVDIATFITHLKATVKSLFPEETILAWQKNLLKNTLNIQRKRILLK